ncbi:PEP-utilizing enzyme [Bacteroidota bacterium]
MKWSKLLARENTDLVTIEEIDRVFFKIIWDYEKTMNSFFTHYSDRNLTHYTYSDMNDVGKQVFEEYFGSIEKIKQHYERGRELVKEIKKQSSNWKEKINQSNLLEAVKEFRKQYNEIVKIYSILSWVAIESWQKEFETIINSLVEKSGANIDLIVESVYHPWKSTAIMEIREELLSGKSPKELAETYQFMRSWSLVWYRKIDSKWIEDISKVPQTEKKLLDISEIISILKPNEKERKYIEMSPYITFFKDYRDDIRRIHAFSWVFLFENIASILKMSYSDVGYFTMDELEEFISNEKDSKKLLSKRKGKDFIVTSKNGKLAIINSYPDEYKKIVEEVNRTKEDIEVKGLIGNKGKITGHVKIVRTYHDIKRVDEGDIIVANTTHPNYLPGMVKSSAFVTNEGGMISHTAIVARELNKPCIVGTKIATKVFKDGDLVEVDANKGVVRKI